MHGHPEGPKIADFSDFCPSQLQALQKRGEAPLVSRAPPLPRGAFPG